MTFTNEQLRKFAELGGWKWKRDQQYVVATGNKLGKPWRFMVPPESVFDGLDEADGTEIVGPGGAEIPDFLRNLPSCFDVLEHFCEKRGLLWEVGNRVDESRLFCLLQPKNLDADDTSSDLLKIADTKQEAILAAVLAAGGEQ